MEVLGAILCRNIQKYRVLLPGQVICWSIYCGDDVDFGNGPRIFIDNMDEDPTSNYLSSSRLCRLRSTVYVVLFGSAQIVNVSRLIKTGHWLVFLD